MLKKTWDRSFGTKEIITKEEYQRRFGRPIC
jgi:hypothetical protein